MKINRIIEKQINKYLKQIGALIITGPRFCGKTFTTSEFCESSTSLENIDLTLNKEYVYERILNGDNPKLLDDWHEFPIIWDLVRNKIDSTIDKPNIGLYILSGSIWPINRHKISHTGAGRFIQLKMQTLTFAEILNLEDNEESVSLQSLFEGNFKITKNDISLPKVCDMMILGGWPEIINNKFNESSTFVKNYIDSISNNKNKKIWKLNINKNTLYKILYSICKATNSKLNLSTILNDIDNCINRKTLEKYIQMLYDMEIIFDIQPWCNLNIRSKQKVRTRPNTYICDTTIIMTVLNIKNKEQLYDEEEILNIIFKNQVMKDLTVYTQALEGKLYYYRDENDNEIDVIIKLPNGQWGAIEIKLSDNNVAEHSNKLINVIKSLKIEGPNSEPIFKAIITNTDYAYKLENDVYVIPHTLLKP